MPDNKNNKNSKPAFDRKAFKHAISQIESSGGRLLDNPNSSASGRYHFLYNLIKGAPEMRGVSKREFINNGELQEQIMDLALDNKLAGFTYGPDYAQKFIDKHNSNLSVEKATALIHFLGPGDAVAAIKDPDNFKVKGTNLSVDQYLGKFNKNYGKYNQYQQWLSSQQKDVNIPDGGGGFKTIQEGPEMMYDKYGHAVLQGEGFTYQPPTEQNNLPKQADASQGTTAGIDPTLNISNDQINQTVQPQPQVGELNKTYRLGDQESVQGLQSSGGVHRIGDQQNVQGVNEFMLGGMMGEQLGQVGDNAAMAEGAGNGPGALGVMGAAGTALELGKMAFGKTGIDKSGMTAPEEVPSKGSAALNGAMKGAAAGASFGPWGAAIGGAVGAGAGLIGNAKAAKEANEADIAYTGNLHNQATNNYAMGGQISGAPSEAVYDASKLVTKFENGGSHSQNFLGGIPQGIGANGKPNLVEEGETKWNDYIFSNNITTNGEMSNSNSSNNKFAKGGELDPPTKEDPPSTWDKLKNAARHYSKPTNMARAALLGPIGEMGLNYIKSRVAENINPVGYGESFNTPIQTPNPGLIKGPLGKVLNAVVEPQGGSAAWNENGSDAWLSERQDLLNMMMNDQLPSGRLSRDGKRGIAVSQYRPSNAVEGTTYYDSPATESSIIEDLRKDRSLLDKFKLNKDGVRSYIGYGVNDTQAAHEQQNVLGNYRMTMGKDEKGDYIDYYDKWDLQPWKDTNKTLTKITDAAQKMAGVVTPEIYGRVYMSQLENNDSSNKLQAGGDITSIANISKLDKRKRAIKLANEKRRQQGETVAQYKRRMVRLTNRKNIF